MHQLGNRGFLLLPRPHRQVTRSDPPSVLTSVFRFLDSKGVDCGVTARDSFALSIISQAYNLKNSDTATDLEKKMTNMAASLVVNKVKEEIKEEEEEGGIANITIMAGTKNSINGVKNLKYVNMLFHSGQQLFLRVEGKGKKGLRVEAEWLAEEEMKEMVMTAMDMAGTGGGPVAGLSEEEIEKMATAIAGTGGGPDVLLEDYMAKRGLVSLQAKDFALPLQCGKEGELRWVLGY